jgi:hypothetical protein
VFGAFRQRLVHAREKMRRSGFMSYDAGMTVIPWPEELIDQLYEWINAYLSHAGLTKSGTILPRLLGSFPWLGEFFSFGAGKINRVCPAIRARHWKEQVHHFRRCFPSSHVAVQKGNRWLLYSPMDAVSVKDIGKDTPFLPRLNPTPSFSARLPVMRKAIRHGRFNVVWIAQTDRNVTGVMERRVTCRWVPTSNHDKNRLSVNHPFNKHAISRSL